MTMCTLLKILQFHHCFLPKRKKPSMGWQDGSAVKSTDCSSRGPEFNFQQPHGGSQPSVMRSGAPFWCAGVLRRNVVYIINKIF